MCICMLKIVIVIFFSLLSRFLTYICTSVIFFLFTTLFKTILRINSWINKKSIFSTAENSRNYVSIKQS